MSPIRRGISSRYRIGRRTSRGYLSGRLRIFINHEKSSLQRNMELKSNPGTYALILKCNSNVRVQVGRLGEIDLRPGYYIYIGSAFGPGGVRGRVSRHFRREKPRHWHIDYLHEHASPIGVWYSYEVEHLEHFWAQALSNANVFSPIQGFGCSDCKCFSHLFHTSSNPDFDSFANAVGGMVQVWKI